MDSKPLGGDVNKFYGEYIGKVEDVTDPKKLLRVRVRVFSVFTDAVPMADLPWAEYRLPVGSRFNDGFFIPADVGDFVWVKFPYDGDTRRPVIIGSAHYAPDGKPNFPHEAWVGDSVHKHKRKGNESDPADHEYHKDVVFSQHGTTIEFRNDKSFSITQRGTSTELCINPDGTIVIHGENHIYFSSAVDTEGKVGGNLTIDITGDTIVNTQGDTNITTSGATDITTTGKTTISSDMIDIDGGGELAGCINGLSMCHFTGHAHSDISATVKVSK